MVKHLPMDEYLGDYACGASSPAMSLLIAAHLSKAPISREKVADMERVGGALLNEESDIEMPEGSLEAVFRLIDDAPQIDFEKPVKAASECPLPQPVLDCLDTTFDRIPWKFRLPGVVTHDVAGFGDEKVTLLRARPGAKIPQHTHIGSEVTLVLQGILMDDGVEYKTGDIAFNGEDDDHQPKALGDEDCYCLIVQEGDVRFTGRFSRILNIFGE